MINNAGVLEKGLLPNYCDGGMSLGSDVSTYYAFKLFLKVIVVSIKPSLVLVINEVIFSIKELFRKQLWGRRFQDGLCRIFQSRIFQEVSAFQCYLRGCQREWKGFF